MKSRLLILFLFGYLGCFGQVPNTATFSLQNVVDIVGGTNLTQAFANSIDANFDPAYKGAKNNLYNFRNYNYSWVPTITTTSITAITQITASGGGNVTLAGGSSVTARGICWSTSTSPTISNSKTTNGSGTGSFSSSITGLGSETTYYVRAYASNSYGTGYGNEVSFTTPVCSGNRPSGLTNVQIVDKISVYPYTTIITITSSNAYYYSLCMPTCQQIYTALGGQIVSFTNGVDVFYNWGFNDCNKISNGYYLLYDMSSHYYAIQIIGGKMYFLTS